jgi:hypothetical protein
VPLRLGAYAASRRQSVRRQSFGMWLVAAPMFARNLCGCEQMRALERNDIKEWWGGWTCACVCVCVCAELHILSAVELQIIYAIRYSMETDRTLTLTLTIYGCTS